MRTTSKSIKNIILGGIVLITSTILLIAAVRPGNSYNIKGVYQEVRDGDSYYATLSSGESGDVDKLYQQSRGQSGTFTVRLTRIGSNFYRIDGTSSYILTQHCYQYAYGAEATVTLSGYGGYSAGTVEFE